MLATRCTPSCVFVCASSEKKTRSPKPVVKNKEIEKLKLIARWNLRATQSALKDCEEMIKILDNITTK
jgi:hypothetical protein